MNLFEKASRKNLMIATSRGTLAVNDLWDLPLTSTKGQANLDDIARALHEKVSKASVSFVNDTPTEANESDTLAFEIVKHIIAVRKEENKAALDAANRKQQKQRIMELLAQREDKELSEKSTDELKALMAAL